jgi:hypothetical protein
MARSIRLWSPTHVSRSRDAMMAPSRFVHKGPRGWLRWTSTARGRQQSRTNEAWCRGGIVPARGGARRRGVPEFLIRHPGRTPVRHGAGRGNRTHTPTKGNRILSPARLPVPPFRPGGRDFKYTGSARRSLFRNPALRENRRQATAASTRSPTRPAPVESSRRR